VGVAEDRCSNVVIRVLEVSANLQPVAELQHRKQVRRDAICPFDGDAYLGHHSVLVTLRPHRFTDMLRQHVRFSCENAITVHLVLLLQVCTEILQLLVQVALVADVEVVATEADRSIQVHAQAIGQLERLVLPAMALLVARVEGHLDETVVPGSFYPSFDWAATWASRARVTVSSTKPKTQRLPGG
jgi:hypothetical protein